MDTPLVVLEKIESKFIDVKHDNVILQHILTQLDTHIQSVHHVPCRSLTMSIKTSVLKQQLQKNNFASDG